jgi:hypothetical protein
MKDARDASFKSAVKIKDMIGSEVYQVQSFRITGKDGTVKGYQYIAENKDFSQVIIRKCAGRQYDKAFFYEAKKGSGWSFQPFWSFGKNPDSRLREHVTASHMISHK